MQLAVLCALPRVTTMSSPPPKGVVIGGGVGGLYTAARLARAGLEVTLIEKNARQDAGGRLACETVVAARNGRSYRFEMGPSLLLLPSVYRESLQAVGLEPDARLKLSRVRPSYAVHFADGAPTPLEIGGDAASEERLRESMESVEPGAYAAYQRYLASARANLDAGLPIFIKEQLGRPELATLPAFLQSALLSDDGDGRVALLRDWPLRSHGAQLADLFTAPRHRELGAFQDLYVGLKP